MPYDVQGALAEGHTLPEIADYLGQQANFDVAGARQAGYTDQAIVQHLTPDTSFGSALRYGAAQVPEGLANTADVAGAPQVGGYLHQSAKTVGPGDNYDPAAPHVGQELQRGHYGEALSYVPRTLAEGVGQGGAAIAAGAVGGPLASLAAMGVTNYGSNVKARAASAGHAQPTQADYLGAIPGTAGEAALQTLGTGMVPGVRQAVGALPGLLRPAARVALDAGANAGADIAGQSAQGKDIDPYEAAGAAAMGAGARGAAEIGGAGKVVAGRAGEALAGAGLPDVEPEDRPSVVRVVRDITQAKQGAPNASDTELANNVKKQYQGQVAGLARAAVDGGFLDPSDYKSLFVPAFEQAARHNNVLTTGEGTAFGQLLGAIDTSTKEGAQAKDALAQGLQDLNTVSNQSLLRNTVGPFKTLGNFLGQAGAVGGAAASGNPLELGMALMGHGAVGKIGGVLGSGVDRMLGTNQVPIMLQAQRSARALRMAGIDPGQSSSDMLTQARLALGAIDPQQQLAAQLGLNGLAMKPVPNMSATDALSMHPFLQQQLARSLSLTPDELTAGLQAGLTPAQVAKGRDFKEREANTVGGMAQRQGTWPGPGVANANFANTDGMAGSPRTGATTPGYILGDTATGWRPVKPGEVFPPGKQFRMNQTTGQSEVLDAQTKATVQSAMNAAAEETGMNQQQSEQLHSEMASKAAVHKNVKKTITGAGQANARADIAGGVETNKSATQKDTGDQLDANGGSQEPLSSTGNSTGKPAPTQQAKFGGNWKAYIHKGLNDHQIPATIDDIHQAVHDVAQTGELGKLLPDDAAKNDPAFLAQALISHHGNLVGPAGKQVMNLVAARVAQNKGLLSHLDTSTPSTGGPMGTMAGRGPVMDPTRWNGAANAYGRTANSVGNLLAQQGMHSSAAFVNNLHTPMMASTAAKAEALSDHMRTLNPSQRLILKSHLAAAPGLMRGI